MTEGGATVFYVDGQALGGGAAVPVVLTASPLQGLRRGTCDPYIVFTGVLIPGFWAQQRGDRGRSNDLYETVLRMLWVGQEIAFSKGCCAHRA